MLATFAITAWLLAMIPGVGQALMLRQTLTGGPAAALATIGGTATGLVIWATAAAGGLAALLLANPTVYRGLLLAGGGFLVLTGARTAWMSSRRRALPREPPALGSTVGRRTGHPVGNYLLGLATNLGNPKAGVFALSLLPRFLGHDGSAFWPGVGLGVVWATVTAAWYICFVMLVSRGSSLVARPRVQHAVGATSGGILVVVGCAVAMGAR